MLKGKYVFAQLLGFLDWNHFTYLVRKYGGGRYVKDFTCYNQRDYSIFEEFAYHIVVEARACRADDIFELGGNVYAFDSTAIEFCIETSSGLCSERTSGKVASKYTHCMTLKHPYPRGYNEFSRLHNTANIGAYFIVRGKKNNDFRPFRWMRRSPPGLYIFSDAIG